MVNSYPEFLFAVVQYVAGYLFGASNVHPTTALVNNLGEHQQGAKHILQLSI